MFVCFVGMTMPNRDSLTPLPVNGLYNGDVTEEENQDIRVKNQEKGIMK